MKRYGSVICVSLGNCQNTKNDIVQYALMLSK